MLIRHSHLRYAVEAGGTALILAAAIASVILPERLWAFDGLGLYSVSISCAVVIALLNAAAPRFGGYFNPALTFDAVLRGSLPLHKGAACAGAQIAGAFLGVIAAQAAFNLDAVQEPVETAISSGTIAYEFAAAFVFVLAVTVTQRARAGALSRGAAAGLTFFALNAAAPSMSFANPAATIARTLTSNALSLSLSAAGIIAAAQLFGAAAAVILLRHWD
ncbi:MAG: aquaporin [Rhodomicrobium sp.]|nr:aquaporin [Rhodomicrobium sp.]